MRRVAGVVALVALAPAGCGGDPPPPVLTVSPEASTVDAPLRMTVRGLDPGEPVSLRASMADYDGVRWRSRARFRADGRGVVDLRRARALSGSYRGVDPMGLLWSMRPDTGGERAVFFPLVPGGTLRVEAHAQGRRPAVREVRRTLLADGVGGLSLRRPDERVVGEYYAPDYIRDKAAVLVLGGSEGGLGTVDVAALLASHGHPALALAYFDAETLPTGLWRIRLEYFADALRELADLAGVDPDRIAILGISRGSEAALLTATRYPELVGAVIAVAPLAVIGPGDFGRPAWTHHGRPIRGATVAQFGNPSITPDSALIPVERVDGPVLTVAGGEDDVIPADEYARLIQRRLKARSRVRGHRSLVYRHAGHGIGRIVPYQPGWDPLTGGSAQADAAAKADLLPQIVRFLETM